MKRLLLCASMLCASIVAIAASGLTEDKGEGKYGISAGKVSMLIDAGKGAKILSFQYEDKEIISQIQRFNAFGATFWTSPQSEWNWPPVAEYDRLPYEVELGEDRIVMNGKVSEKFGYSIRKEFVALPDENVIQVNYSIINHSFEKRKVAPWEISRVLGKGLIFFECAAKDIWPEGLMSFSDASGCAWYSFDESAENRKINADGKGWLAYTDGDLLFVKDFPDLRAGEAAPGEDEVQVYVNQDISFIELENQGAYTELAPGESLSYSVRWNLIPFKSDCKPSEELAKAARSVLK